MVFTGHIENGTVVFDTPVPLPDGTPVRVEAATPTGPAAPEEEPTFYERYKDIIGSVDLPEDASLNHDHYLYGSQKQDADSKPS